LFVAVGSRFRPHLQDGGTHCFLCCMVATINRRGRRAS
jgi:hypothetical protein